MTLRYLSTVSLAVRIIVKIVKTTEVLVFPISVLIAICIFEYF